MSCLRIYFEIHIINFPIIKGSSSISVVMTSNRLSMNCVYVGRGFINLIYIISSVNYIVTFGPLGLIAFADIINRFFISALFDFYGLFPLVEIERGMEAWGHSKASSILATLPSSAPNACLSSFKISLAFAFLSFFSNPCLRLVPGILFLGFKDVL